MKTLLNITAIVLSVAIVQAFSPLMYRFTEPGSLSRMEYNIAKYVGNAPVRLTGGLLNIEIAEDNSLVGCNRTPNPFRRTSMFASWVSLPGIFR